MTSDVSYGESSAGAARVGRSIVTTPPTRQDGPGRQQKRSSLDPLLSV